MWNTLKRPLFGLSVGLNLAFIAIWLVHAVPGWRAHQSVSNNVADHGAISSALHREIGVTPDQWKEIEFHIRHFREKAREQRQAIGALRGELMDLLAASAVDEQAIQTKQEEILAGQRRMKHMVIDLLLKEKEVLKPEQYRALLNAIHQYCRISEKGGSYGSGFGRVLSHDQSTFPERNGAK